MPITNTNRALDRTDEKIKGLFSAKAWIEANRDFIDSLSHTVIADHSRIFVMHSDSHAFEQWIAKAKEWEPDSRRETYSSEIDGIKFCVWAPKNDRKPYHPWNPLTPEQVLEEMK